VNAIYLRAGLVALVMCGTAFATACIANADASGDYPIPDRILETTCTAEQIMAAARDVGPVYYERCLIDYNNHSPQIQPATQGQMHWFFSMDSTNRKASPTDRDVKPQLTAVATR
jgi:Domain of unknown function (DUF5078)